MAYQMITDDPSMMSSIEWLPVFAEDGTQYMNSDTSEIHVFHNGMWEILDSVSRPASVIIPGRIFTQYLLELATFSIITKDRYIHLQKLYKSKLADNTKLACSIVHELHKKHFE